jgi:hypothetical protein
MFKLALKRQALYMLKCEKLREYQLLGGSKSWKFDKNVGGRKDVRTCFLKSTDAV